MGSLTQFQKSVVIGSLLGDGYVRQMPGRKEAFLEINHSSAQKEYVDWKYSVLKNLTTSSPKERRGNGKRVAYRFYTKQHHEFTMLMKEFYSGGKKSIPNTIQISPITLAVWYMDDGSKCGNSNYYLNTQQFSIVDQYTLLNALEKMGLCASLNKDKKYYRIRFVAKSVAKLKTIIQAHVIPSMKYKLGYDPVETTRRSPAAAG